MKKAIGLVMLAGMAALPGFALDVGDKAPPIELENQDGETWGLSDHLGGKPIVVYFYPGAMTGGCTKQACSYRDHVSAGDSAFEIVGISGDPVQNLKWFQTAEHLNFTLLSDPEGAVAKAYGVPVIAGDKAIKRMVEGREVELLRETTISRWTFIIDSSGKVIYKNDNAKPTEDLEGILGFLKGAE